MVLLASATAATFLLRRAHNFRPQAQWVRFVAGRSQPRAHRVDQQGAQVGVALFADAQQGLLAAAAVLTRDQPGPGGPTAAMRELPPIPRRRDQRRGHQRTDAA